MPVSDSYREFVVEQLHRAVPPVRARRMFGGLGIYSADVFFALVDDDILYLKTDDSTQGAFEERGMKAFQPFGEESGAMHYHELPANVLEDTEMLRLWATRAIEVARRKRKPRARS